MSDISQHIVHHKSEDKGRGLPFAIVDLQTNKSHNDDIYSPSIRDFHVIFWFKKGKGKYYIDFKEYYFEPGSIIMVSNNQIHYMEALTNDHEVYSITFKPEFLYRTDNDLRHLFNFTISDHLEGKQILQIPESDITKTQYIWGNMFSVYNQKNKSSTDQKFYHWLCIFLLFCEDLQSINHKVFLIEPDENTQHCLSFSQLLESSFKTNYSVSFYEDKLALTNKTLARIVKKHLKVTPKEAIDERRVLEMKRLLRGTQKSVKDIAYEFGFDDPTNMVKYFKKHTGTTPANFKHLV